MFKPARTPPGMPRGVTRRHRVIAEATRTPRWVLFLPLVVVVIELVFDFAWPLTTAAGFMLSVLPVVVAFGFGPVAVAASTVIAVGLQMLVASHVHHFSEQHHIWVYVATTLAGVMGTALSWQRLRQANDLLRVRSIADELQHAVLRPVPERIGSLRTAGLYRAAQADMGVGGDLFEVCDTRFGTRVLLGDVRGKGLDAVRTVADVLGAFRIAAHETGDLGELAEQLDRHVLRDAVDDGDDELFVTAVLLQHRGPGTLVEFVNRGHLAPLLLGPDGVRPVRGPEYLPLGLGELSGGPHRPTGVHLPPGHTLLLHTDGVTEARDRAGEFYPLRARLAEFGGTDPVAVVDFLDRDVRLHAGRLGDDLALLALAPWLPDGRG